MPVDLEDLWTRESLIKCHYYLTVGIQKELMIICTEKEQGHFLTLDQRKRTVHIFFRMALLHNEPLWYSTPKMGCL